jgi:outer membrane protein assembly factor BamB
LLVTVRGVAKGKAVGRFEAALGLIGVLALATTYIIITGWNPLPNIQDWLKHTGKLSQPEANWVQRVGDQPSAAVVADGAVIVTTRGSIEARALGTGNVLWTRNADWAAVAGDASSTVAVVGLRGKGLEAVDPSTGTVRWADGAAIGAWTYRDLVLVLSCGGLTDCVLTARAPSDGTQRWKTTVPGIGRVHAGINSVLLGSRELSSAFRGAVAAAPRPVPSLLGFPIDQRVQVVDTASGKRLREETPSPTGRVVVLGGRVLVSTAQPSDGNCRYSLEARDASSGRTVWKKDGYDLRTASGVGCEQRQDPPGSDTALAATRGDNREVFLAARDGRELWVGAPGEHALAADGRYGVVRTADQKSVKVIDLANGSKAWEQPAPMKSAVAITRYAVLVSDPATTNLTAYDPGSGRKLMDAKTDGDVLGYGPTGVLLGRGRTIGFLPFH